MDAWLAAMLPAAASARMRHGLPTLPLSALAGCRATGGRAGHLAVWCCHRGCRLVWYGHGMSRRYKRPRAGPSALTGRQGQRAMELHGDLASRRDVPTRRRSRRLPEPVGRRASVSVGRAGPQAGQVTPPTAVARCPSAAHTERATMLAGQSRRLPVRQARAPDRAVSTTGRGRCVTGTGCRSVIVMTAFGDRWPSGHPTLFGWPGEPRRQCTVPPGGRGLPRLVVGHAAAQPVPRRCSATRRRLPVGGTGPGTNRGRAGALILPKA